jgi:hypothetical protein
MHSGLPVVKEAAMCKFLATTVAEATASKCVNWMGGNGITDQVQNHKIRVFFHNSPSFNNPCSFCSCSTWPKSFIEMQRFRQRTKKYVGIAASL